MDRLRKLLAMIAAMGMAISVQASAVSHTPQGTDTGLAQVADPTLALFAGSDAAGPVPDTVSSSTASSSNSAKIDLSTVLISNAYSAQVSGMADGRLDGELHFSIAAIPEPAEWMKLPLGLLVVAFMARRKTSPIAG